MIYPSIEQFQKIRKKGNLIPIYREILGDLDTPVSAYYKIAEDSEFSFLLESVEGEEKVAQFSFLARDPEMVIQSKDQVVTITDFSGKNPKIDSKSIEESPLNFIRESMSKYKFVPVDGLPRFCGGMVGYLSYDVVRFFERLPQHTEDDLKIPDMLLVLAKTMVIFDHLNHKIKLVHCVEVPTDASDSQALKRYQHAVKAIDKLTEDLKSPLSSGKNKNRRIRQKPVELPLKSNFSKNDFCRIVREAKKQIRAGEIIQVVLSQRFEVDLKTDHFNIYRALRALNPSPYMYYLKLGDIRIIGSSPELLVRCEDKVVQTRPIAGTRPRGKDDAEDQRLADDLLQDKKEIAEHIMLVDLGRNDLGRVSKKGSVELSEFMNIEKYSHVMHIVSNVKGILDKSKDDYDVLQAAFPAGTVSGAPKIRAMEIIEDLENVRRGPYAGCIGYFSFSGNLDTCITIRTIVTKGKKAYIQAGAGIVADSKPDKEYQETVNKAKAQLMAINLAHQQT